MVRHRFVSILVLVVLSLLFSVSSVAEGFDCSSPIVMRHRGGNLAMSSNANNGSGTKPVLVVGATGKVGRRVVKQLLEQGRTVRALVRNPDKANDVLGIGNANLDLVQVDLSRADEYHVELDKAVADCDYIISVLGSGRMSAWSDFLPWRLLRCPQAWAPANHPYFSHYKGHETLIKLAEKHSVMRLVRLHGLTTSFSAWNPVSIIFNMLLSIVNEWNTRTEAQLAASRVPYVVLRPGRLLDDERNEKTTNVQIDPSGKLPLPSKIGRDDLAALAVAAISLPQTSPSYMLACRWCGEAEKQGFKSDGYSTPEECIDALVESNATSPRPPKRRSHRAATALATYVFTAAGIALAQNLFRTTIELIKQ